ncbi:hypothetical protein, partial [Escherichia coli]|uniref:hypothetical protein n=1 Tax=Escherichia coli TaxID=562 RepID=UPI001CC8083F
ENLNREKQKNAGLCSGKAYYAHPAPLRKSEAALLFNNLSDNLCGYSKIRILNVARRKMNTKSQE